MPLSQSVPRVLLTRRAIHCEGYARDDGLLDVEGQLIDVHAQSTTNEWRGEVPAGQPVHDMSVRMTVDEDLTIRSIELCTDAAPYPQCREVLPNLQRLVGLRIQHGFKKELRARAGSSEGCTHVVTLIDNLATVAVRALARKTGKQKGRHAALVTFGGRIDARPALIGSCRAYAADSPVVARLWPEFFSGTDDERQRQD